MRTHGSRLSCQERLRRGGLMPATSGTPGQGSSAARAPWGLVPGQRWRRVLPGEERQLGVLRRWLAAQLPACPARDDLVAVAHELASNAVRHTASGRGGYFAVEVTWFPTVVWVAVADSGAPTGPRLVDDPGADHGRGLLVVRRLSAGTGVRGDHLGRLVWAQIPWTGPRPPDGAPPPSDYQAAGGGGEVTLPWRPGIAGRPARSSGRVSAQTTSLVCVGLSPARPSRPAVDVAGVRPGLCEREGSTPW
jgi:anti-sigma regulatory factor (Ser/Thr protein kinase)